ncbi:MAG: hypothetical protein IKO47_07345 [Ruminococcus sp.]|nr:hypothetical protein [Ruminococcus sp.]
MNNKKKIINTLRSADKASVEKLMAEEAKKNEIFAKAQHRANIEQSEYTYSVSGVEKYERRINMTRIISLAASVVLVTGFIGGGAYLMNNRTLKNTESETLASVTEPATTTAATTYTTTTEQTTSEQNNELSVTKEDLIEKAKDNNCVNYFDKFSADYTVLINEQRENHTEPETLTGKVYLDEVGMTASATVERNVNEKCISKSLIAIKDYMYYNAEETLAETDFTNGGYKFLETPDKYYYVKDNNSDKVFLSPWGRSMDMDVNAPENWEITGERTENGRKIVSISGVRKGDNNYEGVYRELPYTEEVDAATGMILSYDECDSDGNKTYSYKLTNYKFDGETVEFRTASDIISEIENGGYTMR